MTNLTVTLNEEVLLRARSRALEHGTSVNALVRAYLEEYVATDRSNSAITNFLALAENTHGGSGATGRTWSREDLHRY